MTIFSVPGTATARQPNISQYFAIFFTQLNNVNKLRNKVLPPYVNSSATRWNTTENPTALFSVTVILCRSLFGYS